MGWEFVGGFLRWSLPTAFLVSISLGVGLHPSAWAQSEMLKEEAEIAFNAQVPLMQRQAALQALSPKQRACLVLHELEDLPFADVARIEGNPQIDNRPLLATAAQQAAIAIRNAQLHDEIRQQAADLSTLYTVTRMASRSLVLEDVLSRALSSALLSLGFEAGLISLTEPTDGRLRLAVPVPGPARGSSGRSSRPPG